MAGTEARAGAADALDVAVHCARQGARTEASLTSSRRAIELDAFTQPDNTVGELARNVPGSTFDHGAATLSVAGRGSKPGHT